MDKIKEKIIHFEKIGMNYLFLWKLRLDEKNMGLKKMIIIIFQNTVVQILEPFIIFRK